MRLIRALLDAPRSRGGVGMGDVLRRVDAGELLAFFPLHAPRELAELRARFGLARGLCGDDCGLAAGGGGGGGGACLPWRQPIHLLAEYFGAKATNDARLIESTRDMNSELSHGTVRSAGDSGMDARRPV